MILEQIIAEGIAHNSYFIGSGQEAAVIDPRRDIQIYLETAAKHGMLIRYILETHRHEDFVIGSLELAKATGASVYHGPGLEWGYGQTVSEGATFKFGAVKLTLLETPGHTEESVSYLLRDVDSGADVMLFTGDTLFVGEVGRTDLFGAAAITRLAGKLYDSLHQKLLPLGDGIIIYPAHGSGSVCGAKIASRKESTLGIERQHNAMLKINRSDFIQFKLKESLEVSPYFKQMEKYNLNGPPVLGSLPVAAPLRPAEVLHQIESGAVVIDLREPAAFGGAHIKNSYSIWRDRLPGFAGWLLTYGQPIILVVDEPAHLDSVIRYLVRLGFDSIAGYLEGGIDRWCGAGLPSESLLQLTVHQLKQKLDRREEVMVLDVRGSGEWELGHIAGAKHVYVGYVREKLSEIPNDRQVAVICGSGYRSSIAASVLQRSGYVNVANVLGGMAGWRAAGFPVVRQ